MLVVHSQANRDTRPHLIGGHGDYVWATGKFHNRPEVDLETWFIPGGAAGAAFLIRRFLLHVLPDGFQRIRYYGLLANRFRAQRLAQCRALLLGPRPELLPAPAQLQAAQQALAKPSIPCPRCHHGLMLRLATLAPIYWPAPQSDSSKPQSDSSKLRSDSS